MNHIRLILLTLLAWLTVTAEALLRVTEHLLIGGGMANNYITEDSKGRLGVGTKGNGLSVMDVGS